MPFDPTNTMTLNHNSKREGKNDPDLRGIININGTEYQVALWRRNGSKGEFFSGPVEPRQERPAAQGGQGGSGWGGQDKGQGGGNWGRR